MYFHAITISKSWTSAFLTIPLENDETLRRKLQERSYGLSKKKILMKGATASNNSVRTLSKSAFTTTFKKRTKMLRQSFKKKTMDHDRRTNHGSFWIFKECNYSELFHTQGMSITQMTKVLLMILFVDIIILLVMEWRDKMMRMWWHTSIRRCQTDACVNHTTNRRRTWPKMDFPSQSRVVAATSTWGRLTDWLTD